MGPMGGEVRNGGPLARDTSAGAGPHGPGAITRGAALDQRDVWDHLQADDGRSPSGGRKSLSARIPTPGGSWRLRALRIFPAGRRLGGEMQLEIAVRRSQKPAKVVFLPVRIEDHFAYAHQNRRGERGVGGRRRGRGQMRTQEDPHAALLVDSDELNE